MSVLCIALLASGAPWEARALKAVEAAPRMIVLRRCVDLDDLMAAVTTGQVQVAVLAADVSGLDAAAVHHLGQHGVAAVAVLPATHDEGARERLGQTGLRTVVEERDVDDLPTLLRALGESPVPSRPARGPAGASRGEGASPEESFGELADVVEGASQPGRVLAVWGPVGAPGRTTVATSLADLLAQRGRPVIVVDADPHSSVAQVLGVADQVSGLLSAARLQAAGTLAGRVHGVCRALTERLGVLTGVPRPDRREEVLPGAMVDVVEEIATFADVVVDLGSDLEMDAPPGAPGVWTLEVLERADDVVVVGQADPVGLTRLAHALGDLRDACGDLRPRVVVNRTRPTLGWSEKEMVEVLARVAPVHAVHFLPHEQAAVDRALVAAEPATRRESRLARALGAVLDAARPETVAAAPSPRRGRTARPAPARSEQEQAGPVPVAEPTGFRLRRAGTARPR